MINKKLEEMSGEELVRGIIGWGSARSDIRVTNEELRAELLRRLTPPSRSRTGRSAATDAYTAMRNRNIAIGGALLERFDKIIVDYSRNRTDEDRPPECVEMAMEWESSIEDAIKLRAAKEWIPCAERLPELETLVLIATNEGGVFTGKYRSMNGRKFWLCTASATYAANWAVTHWRPLPSAPAKLNSEKGGKG